MLQDRAFKFVRVEKSAFDDLEVLCRVRHRNGFVFRNTEAQFDASARGVSVWFRAFRSGQVATHHTTGLNEASWRNAIRALGRKLDSGKQVATCALVRLSGASHVPSAFR